MRVREFQSLVDERTKGFVGRELIFQAIDGFLADPEFLSGYIVLQGEPGIGKTALMGQLVKVHGYVHHFNIAPQNIRSVRDFLSNICAQLIIRYQLGYATLPSTAMRDSGFLLQLLAEIAAKQENRPVVILVDALDEAEDSGLLPNENRLLLPPALPSGVFFVLTSREQYQFRLFVDHRQDIYLRENDPANLEDVRHYIRNFIAEHRAQMESRIAQWRVQGDDFVAALTEKSEGNFMYLVYVLRDIHAGRLTPANVDSIYDLPHGLREYYQRHWRAMKEQDQERFEKYYEPVVCILATVREPVTIAQVAGWTNLPPQRVSDVIHDWREFLNEDRPGQGPLLYRIYHASFRDFLQEEVGLSGYHDIIALAALKKIPGLAKDGS